MSQFPHHKIYQRMAGAPDKWAFVKNGLNVVDVISILPFYIDLFFLQPPHTSVTSLLHKQSNT